MIPPECQKKNVRIVARRGLLELRLDNDDVIRTVIYERASAVSEKRARTLLMREAMMLGYAMIGEEDERTLAFLHPGRSAAGGRPDQVYSRIATIGGPASRECAESVVRPLHHVKSSS